MDSSYSIEKKSYLSDLFGKYIEVTGVNKLTKTNISMSDSCIMESVQKEKKHKKGKSIFGNLFHFKKTSKLLHKNIAKSESNIFKSWEDIPADKFGTLRNILSDNDCITAFINFCIKCHGHENICFFMEVSILEKMDHPLNILKDEVKRILDRYVYPGSSMEINVTGPSRFELINLHTKGFYDKNMFRTAKKEIYDLMSQGMFVSWKTTKEFDLVSEFFYI
jgi:hypothetical protein